MRARSFAALGMIAAISGAIVAACAIDENGLLPPSADAAPDVPVACVTLDASCLAALPASWKPTALTDASCGAGFTSESFVTNARVAVGGCACGTCQVVGSFTCEAGVPISGGNGCNDTPIASAPPGVCTQASAQHLEAHVVQAGGSVSCFAPNDAGTGALADPFTACVPGCDADFCGGASRCVLGQGYVDCPSGFTLFAHVGTGADPGCAACACEAGAPGACSGNVTGFQSTSCVDSGLVHQYAVGTCNVFDNNTNYGSVLVSLTPPDASCTLVASPPDPGDASLVDPKTICCQ